MVATPGEGEQAKGGAGVAHAKTASGIFIQANEY